MAQQSRPGQTVPQSGLGRLGVSEDAISDPDHASFERLLHDGAQRRGMTVEAYRDLIQATAAGSGVSFATALQVVSDLEKMLPGERETLVEKLAILEQEAARYGVSVGRFVTIMLGGDDGESPTDTDDPRRTSE